MNLLSIMRSYNNCVLRENAKLKSIYNRLIKECDGAEPTEECDACGDPECKDGEICGLKEKEGDAEAEGGEGAGGEEMSPEEFFNVKETGECDASDGKKLDEKTAPASNGNDNLRLAKEFFGMNEGEEEDGDTPPAISDSDFFGAVKEAKKGKKAAGEDAEKKDDGMLSGAEFFSKAAAKAEDGAETNEDDEEAPMSAKDFFAGVEGGKGKTADECDVSEEDEPKKDEPKKDEPKKDEPKKDEPEDDDEALEESLSKYQKANRRLFS